MLEHLNWSELLRSMQDPFTNAPEPAPAAPSPSEAASASGSAPPPSAATEPSQAPPESPSRPQPQEDQVVRLLKENKEVYDKLIYHAFPRALGNGSASLDGFRYYMIVGHSSFFLDYVLNPDRVARHILSADLCPRKDGYCLPGTQLRRHREFQFPQFVLPRVCD